MAGVGVVGLGLLGSAVAGRLRAAGREVIGYDIVAERNRALEVIGGRAAASVAAVAEAADPICVVLPSLSAVEDVVHALAATARGRTVVQMSTISPALTERLARECAQRGVDFLDCPISGTSGMVARGDGIIFVGGEHAVYERWRPLFETILPRAVHVGAAGQAMVLKLVANLLVALHSAAAAEALAMVERAGLDAAQALELLEASAATSRMLQVRGPLIVKRDFPAQMKLDLFMKDLHLIQDAARALETPVPLTDVAERLYAAAQTAGHGGEDLAVVVTAFARR